MAQPFFTPNNCCNESLSSLPLVHPGVGEIGGQRGCRYQRTPTGHATLGGEIAQSLTLTTGGDDGDADAGLAAGLAVDLTVALAPLLCILYAALRFGPRKRC